MDERDLAAAASALQAVLNPQVAASWQVPAGPLEWTCAQTAAHVAHDLLAYAAQLAAAAPDGYLPLDLVVRDGTPPARILQVVSACAALLGTTLAAADPAVRAWHWGPTDPSGFAALGVNEILIHTWDITQGLRVGWQLPPGLCTAVLSRLFPDAPPADPASALLWCTGRIALPGRPRQTSWTLKAATTGS